MIIRNAEEADAFAFAELRWEFQYDAIHLSAMPKALFLKECATFFRNSLEQKWVHWLVEIGNEIVAMVSIQLIPTIPRPDKIGNYFGYLTNFYTKPAFRGKGIGQELLQTVQSWAVGQKLELLIVWSSEEAVLLYKKSGFVENPTLLEWLITLA
ncbi:MAG: GNAT family N-acetyltransferase [Saprospiraceae bacterium]|nr:GNAT family N-acetyltransferase [Saprospiraceae bacterium]